MQCEVNVVEVNAKRNTAVVRDVETSIEYSVLIHKAFRTSGNWDAVLSAINGAVTCTIGANFGFEREIESTGKAARCSMRDNRRAALKIGNRVIGLGSISTPRSSGTAGLTESSYADLF